MSFSGSVVGVLERLKLRYFVTGSSASIYYGEPRLTNDIGDPPANRRRRLRPRGRGPVTVKER